MVSDNGMQNHWGIIVLSFTSLKNWFGEYFDYDSSPDYWLVEISGIPFGLMGEMLQDSEMKGCWSSDSPIQTNRKDVLATVYVNKKIRIQGFKASSKMII